MCAVPATTAAPTEPVRRGTPTAATPEPWLRRHRWTIGIAVAALLGGGYWYHRSRRARRIDLGSVTTEWLAEQEFEAGQHPPE